MEPYIGQIQPFAFGFAPKGWSTCEGQLLPISQYTALFSLIGTTYGGDGRTTFALPDLRGRAMVGQGRGPGLSLISWGEMGGTETITLTSLNMPAHTHVATATSTLYVESVQGTKINPTGRMIAGHDNAFNDPDPAANTPLYNESISTEVNVGVAGGSQPFNKRDPFLGIYICIAMVGIFPSRN